MVDREGHIKLIDFGFAKHLGGASEKTFTNLGTVGYAAPEVIKGKAEGYSFEADLWSFAILLAQLLTGSLPFKNKADPMAID